MAAANERQLRKPRANQKAVPGTVSNQLDIIISQGSIFRSKPIFIPPPLLKMIFSPSPDPLFFNSHRGLFALILPYFAFILPFYFPFSNYLSPFFLFLSPFFLFLLYFPPFSLRLSIFFPEMTSADIFSLPPGGVVIFQYRGPCN
jgi:hypothetical protein